MMWFDNSDKEIKSLEVKIAEAAAYYERKYNEKPDTAKVHPSMLPEGVKTLKVGEITVIAYAMVLPGHIWIGIEPKEEPIFKPSDLDLI